MPPARHEPTVLAAALARPLLAGDTVAFYLWKLAVPWPLGPDYGRTPQWSLAQGWRLYAVAISPLLLAGGAGLPAAPPCLVGRLGTLCRLAPARLRVDHLRLRAHFHRRRPLCVFGDVRPGAGAGLAVGDALEPLAPGGRGGNVRRAGRGCALQTSYWRDTATLFHHARSVNDASAAAAWQLGQLQAKAGHNAEAAALYRRAIAAHPDIVELPVALGDSLVALGDLCKARQMLAEAARRFPDSAVVQENLGRVDEQLGRTDEAIEHYRQAMRLSPEDPAGHLLLGSLLESSGRLAEAESEYEKALSLSPDLAAAHYRLGNIALAENNLPAAIEEYEAAVRAAPDHAEAHANLGAALIAAGKIEAAIEHERTAVRLDRRLPPAHFHLARGLEAQGHRAEAVEEYRRALRLVPPDSPLAGEIQRLLKKQDEAIKTR